MAFGRTYAEILEMMRRAMLETSTARDIVRKSGVRPGGAAVSSSRGPSLLAAINPARGNVVVSGGAEDPLRIVYGQVLHSTGLVLGSVPTNATFRVPEDGVYRIDAQVGVWRTNVNSVDRGQIEIIYRYDGGTQYQRVFYSGEFVYSSSTFPGEQPIVHTATTVDKLQAGMTVEFTIGHEDDPILGGSNIESRPDSRYSRLGIQLVRAIAF